MTEIQNLPLQAPICSPFTDIVNTFLQKVQEEVCKSTSRTQIPQKTSAFEPCSNQKQNNTLVNLKKIDRTLKIQKNIANQNFVSARTIHKVLGKPQQVQDNPQWDFLQDLQNGEISHVLRTEAQFSQIVKVFVQFAKKQKLVMFQQTSSFVTIKKAASGTCGCFLKIWSSSEPDGTVYQLRKFGKTNQRFKLILVQGLQLPFHAFYLQLLRLFDEKNLIKLLQGEKVQLNFDEEKTTILEYSKISEKIIHNLTKNKEVKSQEIQSLVSNIKKQNVRLKELIKQKIPETENLPTLERQVEDLCFQKSGIASVFQELYSKDYANYRQKREKILKKISISELFLHLQICDHYEQFKRRRSFKEIELAEQKIPYMLAVRELKKFSKINLLGAALQSIVVFHQKIRVSYNNYFKNTFKIGDMDDFLPITIFCVLAVDCEQNMLGKVKMLLSQFEAVDEAEWQKKTLTDIEAAFQFILNQWKITQ